MVELSLADVSSLAAALVAAGNDSSRRTADLLHGNCSCDLAVEGTRTEAGRVLRVGGQGVARSLYTCLSDPWLAS